MLELNEYKTFTANLGIAQSVLYKLQRLRSHFLKANHLVTFFSKYAKFPLKCRPNTSDASIFRQIYLQREYRCLDDIQNANLIVDCGANVGYSSAYFLSRFPSSYVIAIEPDPDNFALLKTNLAPYNGRYRAVNSAVWSQPMGLVLSNRDGGESGRSVRPALKGEEATIIATDVGTLLQESGCDRISILKIDIEGAEAFVFSSNYESWIKRVDNLVIELHDHNCVAIFRSAISNENFLVSNCDELTVCRRAEY
jgi:FkbM family methyltransferase